ncbi:prepilin-type N-terminal cleavage/methylation domain-containing protein [Bacteriovoracaceae bacterium]|nr:prepilin-type N-terminal cleavage/methylation domain-containing protein [Bacteriovoracaceae bacterium]
MKNQSGMSLIEVLIAIFLLAVIMVSVIQSTSRSYEIKDFNINLNEENLALSAFYQRFSWDFGHIYSPRYHSNVFVSQDPNEPEKTVPGSEEFLSRYQGNRNFSGPNDTGLPIPIFKSEQKNTFTFLTTGYRRKFINEKNSQFAWIQYGLKKFEEKPDDNSNDDATPPEGETLVRRVYTQNPWTGEDIDFDNIKSQRILDGVTSLVFKFWDEERLKFVDSLREMNDGQSLIRAVKIEITYTDKEGEERTSSQIFLPLTLRFVPETEKELNSLRQEFEDDDDDDDDDDGDDGDDGDN